MGKGNFVWGLGFDAGFPTASKDVLGSEKYTAGPSALGVYLGPKWKVGSLAQHYWSYAGDSDRSDVNMTNLQYFYYYAITPTLNIGAGPNIIANWEQKGDDRFTVPVGLGVNTTVNFGKVPVRFGLEFHKSVIKPDDVPGSDYDVRFYVIPAVPSALFKWMGKPAARPIAGTKPQLNDLVIRGSLVSVVEDSKKKHIAIGFGSGETELQAAVEEFQVTDNGLRKFGGGSTDPTGSKMPGEAVGAAGLLAMHNPIGLIVSTGEKVHEHKTGSDTLDARARDTARKIADVLKKRFQEQGWSK